MSLSTQLPLFFAQSASCEKRRSASQSLSNPGGQLPLASDSFRPLHFGTSKKEDTEALIRDDDTQDGSKTTLKLPKLSRLKRSTSSLFNVFSSGGSSKIKDDLEKYQNKMNTYLSGFQTQYDPKQSLGKLDAEIPSELRRVVYSEELDSTLEELKQGLQSRSDGKHFAAVLVVPTKSEKTLTNNFREKYSAKPYEEDETYHTGTAVFPAGGQYKKLLYIITNDEQSKKNLKKNAKLQFNLRVIIETNLDNSGLV